MLRLPTCASTCVESGELEDVGLRRAARARRAVARQLAGLQERLVGLPAGGRGDVDVDAVQLAVAELGAGRERDAGRVVADPDAERVAHEVLVADVHAHGVGVHARDARADPRALLIAELDLQRAVAALEVVPRVELLGELDGLAGADRARVDRVGHPAVAVLDRVGGVRRHGDGVGRGLAEERREAAGGDRRLARDGGLQLEARGHRQRLGRAALGVERGVGALDLQRALGPDRDARALAGLAGAGAGGRVRARDRHRARERQDREREVEVDGHRALLAAAGIPALTGVRARFAVAADDRADRVLGGAGDRRGEARREQRDEHERDHGQDAGVFGGGLSRRVAEHTTTVWRPSAAVHGPVGSTSARDRPWAWRLAAACGVGDGLGL